MMNSKRNLHYLFSVLQLSIVRRYHRFYYYEVVNFEVPIEEMSKLRLNFEEFLVLIYSIVYLFSFLV